MGGIGIDCRYCHNSVEVAASAGIPPTKTCINCHSQIWSTSPYLEPVRASFREDKPLQWMRVHDLPDFVYFNHSIHVKKGVGCETCHGRVDRMPLMLQQSSLQMEWCLDCHRNPAQYVRPREEVFTMGYARRRRRRRSAPQLVAEYKIQEPDQLLGVPPVRPRRAPDRAPAKPQLTAEAALPARDEACDGTRNDGDTRSEGYPRPAARPPTARGTGAASRRWPRRPSSRNSSTASSRRTPRSGTTRSAGAAFLKLMGASLALAGVTGCTRQPDELIVPYVRQPEEVVPGKPLFFATAMSLGGVATGLLVESHEGRPTKIEGNPDHPGSLGAHRPLRAGLDPHASTTPTARSTITQLGEIRPWSGFIAAIRGRAVGAGRRARAPACASSPRR